jgi:LysM repeat protein
VIQPGDTLLKISTQFNVGTEAIQEANGIVDPRFLQIGQALIIPTSEDDTAEQPTATPTPLPLDVDSISFQETRQGTLWCLGSISNPGSRPLTEVVVEVSLMDADGVLLAREAAYVQLDVILPGKSAPFAVLFETPPNSFAQYQVVPVSGVPLAGDTRYYFDLETFDLRGSPEGLATYRINGQLRNYGGSDAVSIRLVTVAFNKDNQVLAQRQAELGVNLLRAGATTPFRVDLIIPTGAVDRFEVLAQGLQPE